MWQQHQQTRRFPRHCSCSSGSLKIEIKSQITVYGEERHPAARTDAKCDELRWDRCVKDDRSLTGRQDWGGGDGALEELALADADCRGGEGRRERCQSEDGDRDDGGKHVEVVDGEQANDC